MNGCEKIVKSKMNKSKNELNKKISQLQIKFTPLNSPQQVEVQA